jgi:hypothetical protein
MMHLEDMNIGQRIVLTIVIALVVLFIIAFIGWISGGWDQTPAQELSASPFDQRLVQLDREALDDAYRGRVVHLFDVWMKDEAGQPGRALVGVRQARRAYIEAMTEIAKREQAK